MNKAERLKKHEDAARLTFAMKYVLQDQFKEVNAVLRKHFPGFKPFKLELDEDGICYLAADSTSKSNPIEEMMVELCSNTLDWLEYIEQGNGPRYPSLWKRSSKPIFRIVVREEPNGKYWKKVMSLAKGWPQDQVRVSADIAWPGQSIAAAIKEWKEEEKYFAQLEKDETTRRKTNTWQKRKKMKAPKNRKTQ